MPLTFGRRQVVVTALAAVVTEIGLSRSGASARRLATRLAPTDDGNLYTVGRIFSRPLNTGGENLAQFVVGFESTSDAKAALSGFFAAFLTSAGLSGLEQSTDQTLGAMEVSAVGTVPQAGSVTPVAAISTYIDNLILLAFASGQVNPSAEVADWISWLRDRHARAAESSADFLTLDAGLSLLPAVDDLPEEYVMVDEIIEDLTGSDSRATPHATPHAFQIMAPSI